MGQREQRVQLMTNLLPYFGYRIAALSRDDTLSISVITTVGLCMFCGMRTLRYLTREKDFLASKMIRREIRRLLYE